MFIFETPGINKDIIMGSGILETEGVSPIEKRKVTGDTSIIQLAIVVTPVIITSLTTLIVTFMNSKKEFTLKANGEEISLKGYSKKEIKEILSCYIENSNG